MKLCSLLAVITCGVTPFVSGQSNDGYYLVPAHVSAGGDIIRLEREYLSQRKKWCTENPECLAFDTNGYAKKTLRPRSEWTYSPRPLIGMWIKNTTQIPPNRVVDNYKEYDGYDIDGQNLARLDGLDSFLMKGRCNSRVSCKAFNSEGWIKKYVPLQTNWLYHGDKTETLYVKVEED
jgi:hypothetical protein